MFMDSGRPADGIEFPALRGWCVRLQSGNGERSKKFLLGSAAGESGHIHVPSDTLRECFLQPA